MLLRAYLLLSTVVACIGISFVNYKDSSTIRELGKQTVYIVASEDGPALVSALEYKQGDVITDFNYEGIEMVWVDKNKIKEVMSELRFEKCLSRWPSTETDVLLPTSEETGWHWPMYNSPWIQYVHTSQNPTAKFNEDGSLTALTDVHPGSKLTTLKTYAQVRFPTSKPADSDLQQKAIDLALLRNTVYIDKSKIHGLGIFCSQDFKRGSVLTHFDYDDMTMTWAPHSELNSKLEPNISQLSNWQWSTNGTHGFLPAHRMRWFNPEAATLFIHYLNHNSNGNVLYDQSNQNYYARKDLKAGDEITVDYRCEIFISFSFFLFLFQKESLVYM